MAPFLSTTLLILTTSPNTFLEVCLSPGCMADGAPLVLERLSALTPLSIEVKPGTCQSLCGKGPIVIQNGIERKTIYKRIKRDSLLKMLKDDLGISVPLDLINSLDLIEQAQEAANAKMYDKAIELYHEGMEKSKSISSNEYDKNWMCKAHLGLAKVLLIIGDAESAADEVREAMTINEDDNDALELLVSICNQKRDSIGEFTALSKLLAQSQDNQSRDIAIRRRTQGFRLQKLQQELEK